MNENKTITQQEFNRSLMGFFGTSNYYEHKVTEDVKLLLTDGCNWVRETTEARWLFNEILFNQPRPEINDLPFQVWILENDKDVEGECWVLRCEDGNDNTVLVQMILDVDFPIYELRIWVVDGVAMLPSEY